MISDDSNSWLEMVPTIERGSPRGARAARDAKREQRALARCSFSYGRTKLLSSYCSCVIGMRSSVTLFNQ